jgi:hypothetical protein
VGIEISTCGIYGSALEGDSKFGGDYPWRRGGGLKNTRVVLWGSGGTESFNRLMHERRRWGWTKNSEEIIHGSSLVVVD